MKTSVQLCHRLLWYIPVRGMLILLAFLTGIHQAESRADKDSRLSNENWPSLAHDFYQATILSNLTKQDLACFGDSNGTATLNPSGGTPPYSIQWSTGETTATITGLSAGPYGYTITDATGNSKVDGFSILEPGPIIPAVNRTNISCFGANDGAASLNPFGGTPPYSYLWSTGSTASSISNLGVGFYSYTVTDANGCTRIGDFSINTPWTILPNISVQDVSCFGGNDGSATLNPLEGTPPYSFEWSTGATTATISGLSAGFYSYTITDANGCTYSSGVLIRQAAPIIPNASVVNVSGCHNDANGSATLNPSGGTPPYSYVWSTGETTATITGLSAGSYSYTITDSQGCVRMGSLGILNMPPVIATVDVQSSLCFGDSDGAASLTVMGGTPPYTYLWSNGATTATITGLMGGPYSYTVTDANGCTYSGGLCIMKPAPIIPNLIRENISCFGAADGSATLNPSGGTPPYTYLWSNGSTSNMISGLDVGNYAYTITDANGCTRVGDFSITTPWPIIPNLEIVYDGCSATASLNPFEGTPPYTYMWSTGETTATITGLGSGTYSYTITDANGCTYSDTFVIDAPASPVQCQINVLSPPTPPSNNGMAAAIASGGTAPYTYEWSNGETTVIANSLPAGFISVTITDATGCTAVCFIDLLPMDEPCIDNIDDPGVIGYDQVLCGAGNDPDPLVNVELPSGGTGTIEYLWMFSNIPGPFNTAYWQPITNSNSPNYDPGVIYETTYYVRCARIAGEDCPYLESNILTVEVGTDAIAEIVGPELVCTGDIVTFEAITATTNAVVEWTFTGPVSPNSASGNSATVTFGNFGLAQATLTVTENGCTATAIQKITVTDSPIYCGNLLPNNPSGGIQVYPNPAQDVLHIALPFEDNLETEIYLFDFRGRPIWQQRSGETLQRIDVGHLPSGFYVLKVIHNNELIHTAKVSLLQP